MIECLRTNFYIHPQQQKIEIIDSIDYSSGIFFTTFNKDQLYPYGVLDLNILYRAIQYVPNLNEEQSTNLNAQLLHYYKGIPYDENLKPTLFHRPIIFSQTPHQPIDKIPDYIQQRVNII